MAWSRVVVGVWAALLLFVTAVDVGAAGPTTASSGLFAPSVCLSPAALIVLVVTPFDTLSNWAERFGARRLGKSGQSNQSN